ncbi:MAG: autotransporter-associated beta strand repeat-containing protein [Verrucomicrobiota bacterium]
MIHTLRRHRRHVSLALVALLSSWQISQPLQAVTLYWDGSTSGAWNVTTNWNLAANGSGAAPANTTTATDDLFFFATGALNTTTQTLGANRTARSLTFGSGVTSALGISGSTLTLTPTGTGLTATGVAIDMTGAGADVSITSAVTLGADQTWLLGTGRTLTIGSFTADGTDDLVVDGAGTLSLGNTTDNSYGIGIITLQNGATLLNTQDNTFGDTTTIINMTSGTTWDKGGFGDAFRGLTGTGSVINAGNLDLRTLTGETLTFSGSVTGPTTADLVKQGQANLGTQVIAGDVNFQDQLLVYSGTLSLANANGAANQIVGTLLMGRSDTTTVRDVAVPYSTLRLDSSVANHVTQNRLHDDEEVQFRSTGHLHMIGNGLAATTEATGPLNIAESNGVDSNAVITLEDGGAGLTLTADSLIRSAGSTLLLRGSNLGTGAAGPGVARLLFDVTVPTITGTLGTPTAGIVPGILGDHSLTGQGAGFVTYDVNGLRLLQASEMVSSFAGLGQNVKLEANQTLAGNANDLTAHLAGAGVTLDLGGNVLSLAGASILSSGTAPATITNGTINFGAATEGFIYTVNDLTLNATITGDTGLAKTGPGTLTINQPQTYTGPTSINGGTVTVGGSFILPASRLNVNGVLNFSGTGTYNRVQHVSGSNLGTLNLNGNTLEMAGGTSVDYYGQLTGTADSKLIKSGTNTYGHRSLNTAFLGEVIVRGGTFRILGDTNSATSLLAGTLTGAKSFLVETGGTLTLDNQTGTDSRAISNRIGDTTPITLNRGTFLITGSNNARPAEVVGDMTLSGGFNTITLDADFGSNLDTNTSHGDVVLTTSRLLRTNFATGLVRGDNLGFAIGGLADDATAANTTGGNAGDPGGAESNFIVTNGITLSSAGTGSAIGIVPYLTGGVSAGSTGSSLVTYAAGNGFRLLDFSPTTTDYFFQAFAVNGALSSTSITGQNVYLDITANNSDPQLDGPAIIGGLVIDNTGGTGADLFLQGNLLTVSGGIILSTGSQTNTISAGGAGGSITFGNNAATGYEGRIHGARRIEINAPIVDNGPNAVSITTDGEIYYTVPQLYTGNTVINSGRIEISGGDNYMPIGGVLTANGNGALRLFGGSQEVGGLQGTGFIESFSTTLVRTLTINTDGAGDEFTFNGILRDGAAMALGLVKKGPGTQIFSGAAGVSTATGTVAVQQGRMVLDGGITNTSGQTFQDNRFAANVPVILGQGVFSGQLQIGGPSGALNQTVAELSSSGTGTANAILGGNGTRSTFTVNQATTTTFNGGLGGAGTFQNNLNFVKNGAGSLTVAGSNSLNGSVTVNAGELIVSGAGLLGSNVQSATVADGAKLFFQHGNSTQTFAGTGNVLTLGSTTGAMIGFGINGATNDQINLTAGQTLTRNGTTSADIYVVGTPTLTSYTLINSAADGSFLGTGSFVAGTIFNPGNFIYNVTRESPDVGNNDRLILTLTAQAAPPDVWWKGDLGGTGTGVWSGSAIGGNTNWDSSQAGGADASVPPDSNSHVHFSANGSANFTTSLGADLTVKQVTFEAGSVTNGVTVGGTDKLTLTGASGTGFTLATGNAGTVTVSAPVGIGATQAWNVEDAAGTLAVLGGVSGTGSLNLNASPTATGTIILGGTSTYTGSTSIRAGRLGLTGTDSLPNGSALTLGSASSGAILQLGTAQGAANVTLSSLVLGSFGSNGIVGGSAALSTLTLNLATPLTLGLGIGGAGTNENNVSLVKKGVGTLILDGANTYVGTTTINQGTVQLGASGSSTGSTGLFINADAGQTAVMDINGRTMTLAGAITLGGASSTSQANLLDTATGGSLTLGGNITYDAVNNPLGSTVSVNLVGTGTSRTIIGNDSTSAATDLTVSGDYLIASNHALTLDGTGNNLFSGDVTSDGVATLETGRDLNKAGTGTWTLTGAINIGDTLAINNGTLNLEGTSVQNDVIVTGATSVLNISGTIDGSLIADTASNGLYIRTGGTVNLLAHNILGSAMEFVLVNENAAGTSTLNLNSFSFTTPRLDVGGASNTADRIGNVIGTGTVNIGTVLNGYAGSVSANLASTVTGANSISKDSVGTVVLSGNNAFGTGNTIVREGELALDFGTHSGTDNKIGTGILTMGANAGEANPRLSLNGHGTVPASQSVASLAMARGAGEIALVNNGAALTLDIIGSITRTNNSTLNFEIGAGTQVKVGATTLTDGIIGAWATVNGSAFATVTGGQITSLVSTAGNDVDAWTAGQHVINTTGFTHVVDQCVPNIASLTFNANAASTLAINNFRSLAISSGGILVTSNVGANNTAITGGRLTGPLVVHQNNTGGTFEISSDRDGALTKSGEGTLILSGRALSNTAAVTLNEGRLVLTGGNAIGDLAPVNIVGAVGSGATVLELLAGQTETIGLLQGGENSNGTVLLNAGSQLTLNQSDGDGTANENFIFGGAFSGSGTLVKSNIDYLTITGLSADFTGAVVADLGRIDLQGASGRLSSATSYTVNAGAELIFRQDQTSSINRISDSAPITLNNTAGTVTISPRNGLWSYNQNQNATRTENVGPITLGYGHNLILSQGNNGTGTGTATISDLVADSLSRGTQRATLLVRGPALGTTTATQRGLIRFDTGATATMDGYEVGGGGLITTSNISIIPWIIGHSDASGAGNTLVTHESAALGLRPLASTEYINDSAAITGTLNNNIRYTASASLTATPTAINALVFDSATAIVLSGTSSSMEVTSGTLLFAGNGSHSISGISGITAGGGRDYSIFTTGTGTVTLDPALTSAVPLVKSGAGTLRLTSVLNAFTSVYLNQGNIEVSNIAALGTGAINFAGGQLNLGTGYTGDLGSRVWNVGTGGGTINVNAINATATNLMLTGAGDLRKLGAGTLTLTGTAASTHTGLVTLAAGILDLNVSGGNAIGTGGLLISGTTTTPTVRLLANDQIADTAKVEILQPTGVAHRFDVNGFSETIGSLSVTSSSTTGTIVATGATGVLTVMGDIILNNNRIADAGTTEFQLLITGAGTATAGTRTVTGTLDLGGADRRIVVESNQTNMAFRNDAVIETVVRNGGIIKEGSRTLYLRADNTYAGATTINQGRISIASATNLGDGSVTNTLALNNGGVLRSTGVTVDLGVNRSISLGGSGGSLEVGSPNQLTASGIISGTDCAVLTKAGTGTLFLTNANTYVGGSMISAGTLVVNNLTGSGTGSGTVTVGIGSTLAGTGRISGLVANSGIIAPGSVNGAGVSTLGQLNIGSLSSTSESILLFQLGGATTLDLANVLAYQANPSGFSVPASWTNYESGTTQHDQLYINDPSAPSLLTTIQVSNIFLNGFVPDYGHVFQILDWTTLGTAAATGTPTFNLPTLTGSLSWDTGLFNSHGLIVVVPEPSRLLLLFIGLLGLHFRRRR